MQTIKRASPWVLLALAGLLFTALISTPFESRSSGTVAYLVDPPQFPPPPPPPPPTMS